MARDFYPFVEDDPTGGEGTGGAGALEVTNPARIAVYDDAAAAPRVVVIEPRDVRGFLEEVTATVTRLAREQGGTIPFMVIREVVENFVHAYFQAPTITILDGGNTIRFSDQGPGIREKDRALEYGTTSATEEMRHYIRGVGSGLPYAQQYMVDKGGSLEIEDNISGGTVVMISTQPAEGARGVANIAQQQEPQAPVGVPSPQAWGWNQVGAQTQAAWGWPQPFSPQPQQPWSQAVPQPYGTQAASPWSPQGAPGTGPLPQQGWPQAQAAPLQAPPAAPAAEELAAQVAASLDDRSRQALSLLSERGSAGPTDLVQAFGSSAATWSRTLSALSSQGAVHKGGQKYQLTEYGRALGRHL